MLSNYPADVEELRAQAMNNLIDQIYKKAVDIAQNSFGLQSNYVCKKLKVNFALQQILLEFKQDYDLKMQKNTEKAQEFYLHHCQFINLAFQDGILFKQWLGTLSQEDKQLLFKTEVEGKTWLVQSIEHEQTEWIRKLMQLIHTEEDKYCF